MHCADLGQVKKLKEAIDEWTANPKGSLKMYLKSTLPEVSKEELERLLEKVYPSTE